MKKGFIMAKYKLSRNKQNLFVLTQKIGKKMEVNESEMKVFEEGLLPHAFEPKIVKKGVLEYKGDASTTLFVYLKKGVTKHKLYSIMVQTIEMTKVLERYHFNLPNLELDPKFIFVKEITGELIFVYEPLYCRENTFNIFTFFTKIISSIKTDDRQLKNECKAILSFLAQPENYRISDIEQFILRQYPQIYQEISRMGSVGGPAMESVITGQMLQPSRPVMPQSNPMPALQMAQPVAPVMADETTLLNEAMHLADPVIKTGARIVRQQNGAQYPLNKPELILGKAMDADVVISDNNAISRHHARIYNNCGAYFLVDEGSKNHTYINGMMVTNLAGERLSNGDEIRLANEEFRFYV